MSHTVKSIIPTKYGEFIVYAYQSEFEQFPHLALVAKNSFPVDGITDVRIHSECMTGDVFSSSKCDCGEQLDFSMNWAQAHGGIVIYLRQEGRGIGLENKLKAYNLQDDGLNTREANVELGFHPDARDYEPAVNILEDLSIEKIRLITNNPEKIKTLEDSSIEVVGRIPIEIEPHEKNIDYLKTKQFEMGHLLSFEDQQKIV